MAINTAKARKEEVDFISRLNGYGSLSSAQANNLRGFNVNLNMTPAPLNQDSYGLTFFTRPELNMSYDNLINDRIMTLLLSKDPSSMARAIRCMLDTKISKNNSATPNGISSDLFDSQQAFIPLLTNNLLSMSGWPDVMVETYTSKEGLFKEAYSIVDGTVHIYNTFDLTANFRNIQGDPITLLFYIWCRYASLVYDGTLSPYPENILENTVDYNTRIYRLIMSHDFAYVQKIAACGAAFPMASPLGNAFSYSDDAEFNRDNDQISVPIRCMGANYLDPILVGEFNKTVELHCPDMKEGNRGVRMVLIHAKADYGTNYGKIGTLLLNLLSHKLYPRIDPDTYALEWYATRIHFETAIKELKDRSIINVRN